MGNDNEGGDKYFPCSVYGRQTFSYEASTGPMLQTSAQDADVSLEEAVSLVWRVHSAVEEKMHLGGAVNGRCFDGR